VYFPRRTVILLFPPIPLPARVFVVLFAALELYFGVTGTVSGVAHFAHLGGMLGGSDAAPLAAGATRSARRRRAPSGVATCGDAVGGRVA
jgi:membrane associated rhomboid family serine protease